MSQTLQSLEAATLTVEADVQSVVCMSICLVGCVARSSSTQCDARRSSTQLEEAPLVTRSRPISGPSFRDTYTGCKTSLQKFEHVSAAILEFIAISSAVCTTRDSFTYTEPFNFRLRAVCEVCEVDFRTLCVNTFYRGLKAVTLLGWRRTRLCASPRQRRHERTLPASQRVAIQSISSFVKRWTVLMYLQC
jgi:hypothetical protein